MTAQNSNIVNAFETTLSAQLASGGTIMVLADDPGITSPAYLVVDPDSDSAREVIEWTAGAYNNATVSRDLDLKHGTDPTHASGTKVRLAVVKQHITDTHERIDDIAVTGAVTGTIDSATQDIATTLASGIDATKIADGTVSDAEFQYLNGVTSAIQTQLDAKQATGSYITADTADTLTNKTIDSASNTVTVDVDDAGGTIQNIADANIKASAAIDATKIADGSVTSAEFQHINTLSSNAQTQLDNITSGATTLTVPITVKVADDGSGSQNVFYFLSGTDSGAGVKSVDFDFKVGTTYKFDTSDSSLSGHNFKFSIVQDGSHNSGSEYTTNVTTAGTPGSAGSSTSIEVTAENLATPKLYYYCSTHSGMGGEGQVTLVDNKLQHFTEVHQDSLATASNVLTLDLSKGNSGSITLTENITQFTFINVPTDGVSTFTLIITQDSSDRTVAISSSVNGGGAANAKTPAAAGYTMSTGSGAIDIITFVFKDASTPYLLVQQAFA